MSNLLLIRSSDPLPSEFNLQMALEPMFEVDERFSSLKVYFDRVTIDDLNNFSESDLLETTAKEDRMLMKRFIQQTDIGSFLKKSPFDSNVSPPNTNAEPFDVERGMLNLRARMISYRMAPYGQGRISTSALRALLMHYSSLGHIKSIDMSWNNLLDDDLSVIAEALLEVQATCEVINLASNRFHGVVSDVALIALSKILSLPKLRYLDITGNALATVDQLTFFHACSKEEFSRLIFIPSNFLKGSAWHIMVTPLWQDLTRETHKTYYSSE